MYLKYQSAVCSAEQYPLWLMCYYMCHYSILNIDESMCEFVLTSSFTVQTSGG